MASVFSQESAPPPPDDWNESFDLVCIGSGAASLSAAIRGHDLGARVLIVEAGEKYGGSTAISGGVVWIPDNPQLAERGIADSQADSLAYLREITLGQVPEDRLMAYVEHARRMLAYMAEKTWLRLDALEAYSDYYVEAKGGKRGGRSMEPLPFDASELGEHFATLLEPHRQSQIMGLFGISAREAHGFLVPSLRARLKITWRLVQYALRWFTRRRFHRDTKLHAGNALIGRLRRSLLDRGVPLWLSAPAKELVVTDGAVRGVVVERAGARVRIEAKRGVLVGAGGFERNGPMRARFQRQPTDPLWNAGNALNQGDGIVMGEAAGGQLARMDEAWWTPVTLVPGSSQSWVLVVEKSLPGSLMVNADAKRFTNEAAPYLDVGRAMYAGNAVPTCFLIFDAEFRHRYPVGPIAPGYAQPDSRLSRRLKAGFLLKAGTLAELATTCGLDPTALAATVERFNTMADAGVDADFKRGDQHYDRYYADDTVKPNPTLRALRRGPFYAIRVYPGDLGTKGGLVTDARGRVLDAAAEPIPGLFAAGNSSASVMGPTYPGAGGTIGPALTFGFLAAEAACEGLPAPAKAS